MRQSGREQAPKPFDFVPIYGHVKQQQPPGHHEICGKRRDGVMAMTLVFGVKALQPIQVGSGVDAVITTDRGSEIVLDNIETTRVKDGKPQRHMVVPGSSLKGATRSCVEAITDSCVSTTVESARRALRGGKSCVDTERLCPACSLFGAQSYLGRVSFHDSIVSPEAETLVRTPNLWQPARGRRLPRVYFPVDTRRNKDKPAAGNPGRKFYFHRRPARGSIGRRAIKRTTVFKVAVDLMPAGLSEAGLIICAVGCHPKYQFPIKLGAGKPVGLGSAEFKLNKVILYGNGQLHLATGRLGGQYRELVGQELEEWVESAVESSICSSNEGDSLIDIKRLEKLACIYSTKGFGVDAPDGAY